MINQGYVRRSALERSGGGGVVDGVREQHYIDDELANISTPILKLVSFRGARGTSRAAPGSRHKSGGNSEPIRKFIGAVGSPEK